MLSLMRWTAVGICQSPADTGARCRPNTVPERWICECHLKHWLAQRRTGKKNGYGAVRQEGRLKEKGIRNKTERGATAAVQRTQLQPAQVEFHMEMLRKISIDCNKHKVILCMNRLRWSMDTLWECVNTQIAFSELYRQVTLVVTWLGFRQEWWDLANSCNR